MSGLIHVGAWDGSEYVDHPGPLVLFEPQITAFTRLVANLAEQPGVTLVNLALGAKPGEAMMHVSSPDHSSSVLAPKKHFDLYPTITFNGKMEKVQVSTLDREMRLVDGDYRELVIDVQGYELEVLKGAKRTLRKIDRITCEVNWDEVYEGCARVEEVDAFLEGYGFRQMKLVPHGQGMCGDAYYAK